MNNILYWPGMRSIPEELCFLKKRIKENGNFKIITMPEKYDFGPLPYKADTPISSFIEHQTYSHWWIGLSLGASVAYIISSLASKNKKPKRLTLINMFHNRKELSIQKKFSLDSQWDLRPINYKIAKDIKIDLVISEYDKKINPIFGLKMLNRLTSNNVNLFKIKTDHVLSSKTLQEELANKLIRS